MDPRHLLETFGTLGLILIVFAESGLLVGFFLPGDSLLFTAGVFCARGDLTLGVVLVGVFLAAVIGDQVGYAFGNKVGPALFRRPDSRFFKQEYIEKAQSYFEKYGPKTIVLARFIPIVRTFAPIVAGAGSMPYRTFFRFNIIGGLLWGVGVTMLGFWLGEAIDIDKYLYPVIGVIIVLSVLPVFWELRKARKHGQPAPADPVEDLDQLDPTR
ncbi:MAG TPA: VTT domain-containing protein [Acidimicrobiales bacterium]|nr:VTT domain-containing protein [Acidimicrobiales bacterium]